MINGGWHVAGSTWRVAGRKNSERVRSEKRKLASGGWHVEIRH